MSSGKRRILCAEANGDVADLIARMLERKGYEVAAVHTAADCLRLAGERPFDLYLLNDGYIDADSVELCRQLRALTPLIPVLLFSLDSSTYGRRKAIETGAQLYESKTSDFVSLVQTIDRLLQHS